MGLGWVMEQITDGLNKNRKLLTLLPLKHSREVHSAKYA